MVFILGRGRYLCVTAQIRNPSFW